MNKKRPRLITLLAYLNILEGILCGLVYLLVVILNGINSLFEITIITKVLLLVYLFLPILISYGLLKGKRWGWIGEVFLFALIALQCILQIYYYTFDSSIRNVGEINWLGALLGLVLSFIVIKYLFSKNVRLYFNWRPLLAR
jgi:hypothetical protein